MGILDFIKNHFFHALPILLSGAFAIAIILERSKALFQTYPFKNPKAFLDKITELVLSGSTNEAVALCEQYEEKKPLARVVKGALIRAHLPESMIEHGIEFEVGTATQAIQKRTSFLATIANVATLLGLFGTIVGLIQSFEAVGHADPQQKSALLAAGIATSMNATMLGLGVAIPCMVAFSFLVNRATRLVSELEHSSVRILEILKQRFYVVQMPQQAEKASNGTGSSANGKSSTAPETERKAA